MAAPRISVYLFPGSTTSIAPNPSALHYSHNGTMTTKMTYDVRNPYDLGTIDSLTDAMTNVDITRVLKLWIFNNGTTTNISESDITKRVAQLREAQLYALSYEIYEDGVLHGADPASMDPTTYLKDIAEDDSELRLITINSEQENLVKTGWIKGRLDHISNTSSFSSSTELAGTGDAGQAYTFYKWKSIGASNTLFLRCTSLCSVSDATTNTYSNISSAILYGQGHSSTRCAKVTLAIIPPKNAEAGTYKFLMCIRGYYT